MTIEQFNKKHGKDYQVELICGQVIICDHNNNWFYDLDAIKYTTDRVRLILGGGMAIISNAERHISPDIYLPIDVYDDYVNVSRNYTTNISKGEINDN